MQREFQEKVRLGGGGVGEGEGVALAQPARCWVEKVLVPTQGSELALEAHLCLVLRLQDFLYSRKRGHWASGTQPHTPAEAERWGLLGLVRRL